MTELLKNLIKGAITVLAITGIVMVITWLLQDLYDFRILIAALGGAMGYKPVMQLVDKIKILQ